MPGYHQIETAIQLKSIADLPSQIEKFANLLEQLGVLNQKNREWLETIIWHESEGGFEYSVDRESVQIQSNQSTLTVRPAFYGFTAQGIPERKDIWISFELLFLSHEVDDFTNHPVVRYKKDALRTVTRMMQMFAQVFPNEHIFFTHEAQEGIPLDGRIENDQQKLWQFELGSIPSSFLPMTKNPDENFHVWERNARTWFANKQVFPDSPFANMSIEME